MTLTEKWDKGELPEGDYYIKRRNGKYSGPCTPLVEGDGKYKHQQ